MKYLVEFGYGNTDYQMWCETEFTGMLLASRYDFYTVRIRDASGKTVYYRKGM